ncbi:PKD domain-containing protein [Parafrankia irregularis]|uniref:PKD domain-containing protein n=1 Tax=Parafrankia irregularis TaxID=795642 RepID=A0A0S4QYE8_9ACTN|nr:PKD domain-containing protein [Parafrankia irregularis]
MSGSRPRPGPRAHPPTSARAATRTMLVGAAVIAAILAPGGGPLPGATRPALAAPDPQGACTGAVWGSCDTRATDNGFQYHYRGGYLTKVPLDDGTGTGGGCGDDCPPDPDARCAALTGVGAPPEMTAAERAEYDALIADCGPVLYDPDGIAVDDLAAQFADYLREELLPTPKVVVQPIGNSFANLPTIMYTGVPAAFTFDVTQPVLATISAVPHYSWQFGDGETGPDAPGRPYDPAISPRDHPDAYVTHQYHRPGTYQVTLTVTWDGYFTVPGVAQAFPLDAVALNATTPITIEEAGGVLVGND